MSAERLCTRCVLPQGFPNIKFGDDGVCNFCLSFERLNHAPFEEEQRKDFQAVIDQAKGKHAYDAICCYSGGKDSTYMLLMMTQEMGLKTLAYTLDNGFITEQSKENIRRVVEALGIDHVFYKPSKTFMTAMYKAAMLGDLNKNRGNFQTRISDACLACISLVNTYAARLALQMHIPLVFSGFTPGQIPRAVIKNNHRFYRETYAANREHFQALLGDDARRYFELTEPDFEIYQMSPYLVYEVSEAQILERIKKLGWTLPANLDGCSSNCSLNAVGNLCHQKKFGFHPYAQELSQLIRQSLLTRDEALQKLNQGVPEASLNEVLGKIGITREQLEHRDRTTPSPRPAQRKE